MSVSLTPASQTESDDPETFDIANGTWLDLTADVPGVTRWNGANDPITYTPEQLRAIAVKHPEWAKQLEWLASEGGARLG